MPEAWSPPPEAAASQADVDKGSDCRPVRAERPGYCRQMEARQVGSSADGRLAAGGVRPCSGIDEQP